MAGLRASLNIPSLSLSSATQTAFAFLTTPANQRVKVLGYGFYFDGAVNTNTPVEIRLCTPITAGTLTTGGTAVKEEPGLAETVQTTVGLSATTQPTLSAATTFKTITVHPQLGYEFLAPLGQEKQLAGGTSLIFSVLAAQSVDIRGYVLFEE